ncbi:unnamed protein product [Meloidogyne enterolobii]|uniref:Uncharacterized protein n=1 Tax=Meloidogyne enterolobii TaxID=390850 RepID=A0ACB0YEA0_MELEN
MEVILAINRCIELLSSELAKKNFWRLKNNFIEEISESFSFILTGKRLLFWLGIPLLYGISVVMWEKHGLFSGIYFSWFLNPHIGYIDDVNQEYQNTLNAFHDLLIIFFLSITYLTFFIIFIIKSKQGGSQHSYSEIMVFKIKYSHNPKFKIFLQIFLISLFNSAAAFIYVYMQYIHINEVVIIIGQICWLNAHGGKYF